MHTSAQTENAQPVAIYLSEVGRYPLLSHAQEIELAACIQQGLTAKRTLETACPSHAEYRKTLEERTARGKRARQRLIECNLRLVIYVARRYTSLGLPLEDLVQEGNMGLMEAAERYDHTRGTRFSTYARWWIKQAICKPPPARGALSACRRGCTKTYTACAKPQLAWRHGRCARRQPTSWPQS